MNKSGKRGQVAIEYMILVMFLLFIITIAAAYAMFVYYENVKINNMRNVVLKLEKASDQVYALGPGNNIFVDINLPAGVTDESIAINKEITYRVELYGGVSDFVVETKGNISEFSLPYEPGVYTIKISAVDQNIVFTQA